MKGNWRWLAMVFAAVTVSVCLSFNIPIAEAAGTPHLATKSGSVVVGAKKAIKVKSLSADSKVSFKSSKRGVATVSPKGKVKGVRAGKATIAVRVKRGGKTKTLEYAVTVKKPKISKRAISLAQGDMLKLAVKNKPKKATCTWSSASSAIATVDKKGCVTGQAEGSTTIKVKVKTKQKTYKLKTRVTVSSVQPPVSDPSQTPARDTEAASDGGAEPGRAALTTLDALSADTENLLEGTPTNVVFTCNASNVNANVNLCASDGTAVATMKDDGEEVDLVAEDGIYSCIYKVDPSSISNLSYFAKCGDVTSSTVGLNMFTHDQIDESAERADNIDFALKEIERDADLGSNDGIETAYKEMRDVLDQEKSSGSIEGYVEEGGTFVVKLPYYTYAYEFNPEGDYQDDGSIVAAHASRDLSAQNVIDAGDASYPYSIATAQPYASELDSDVFDNAAKTVEGANLGYGFAANIDDGNVSIDTLKHLSGYKLIIWDGHGGYSSDLHSFLGTGESSHNAQKKYAADIANNRIISLSGGNLGVTSRFFTRYYVNSKLDDCLFYIGACHGAEDNVLSDALISIGARTVVGFKSSVKTAYNRDICETFFDELVESDGSDKTVTARTAFDRAKSDCGESDPHTIPTWWDNIAAFFGWADPVVPAVPILSGDEGFRLKDAVEAAGSKGAITGYIRNAKTAEPMKDVVLSFYDVEGTVAKKTVNLRDEDDGYYSVKLPVGDYRMVASADGYVDFVSYINIKKNRLTYSDTFYLSRSDDGSAGAITGTIVDALSGEALEGVSLEVRKGWNNTSHGDVVAIASTAEDGDYSLSLPVGNYTLNATKDGYVASTINVYNSPYDDYTFDSGMMSSIYSDAYRIVLTWGANPRDMDSHVAGALANGENFHVYFANKRAYDDDGSLVCELDLDDTTSYGPETTTLLADANATYYYYVHRYAGSGTTASSASKLEIYRGNERLMTMSVPTNRGSGDYWNAFAIKDGNIVVRDTITWDEAETSY